MSDCKVISHRGANKQAPQNTIPAFEKSLEIGVDGFETDVHMSADGVPVVCHNYTIDETSDGKGEISSKTLEELRCYDFGSYFHEKFKGTQIPTLDEFLTLCETADIEIMNIELKTPLSGEKGIVEKTISAVKEHGLFDKLLISSFSPELLVECKRIDPKCKTGFLYSPDRKIAFQTMILGLRCHQQMVVFYLLILNTDDGQSIRDSRGYHILLYLSHILSLINFYPLITQI